MLNKLKNSYQESMIRRILSFGFVDQKTLYFLDTFFGKIFLKLHYPKLSFLLVITSLVMTLYEQIFVRYTGNLSLYSLVLLVLALIVSSKKDIRIYKLDYWYIAFLLFGLVSGLVAANDINPQLIFLGWLLFAQFYLIFFVSRSFRQSVLKTFLLATIPMLLAGLYQFIFQIKTPETWLAAGEGSANRIFGFMGSPNVYGALMVLVALVSNGLYLKNKNKLYLIYSLISVFIVILTLSRSSWLSLLGAVTFLMLYLKPRLLYLSPLTLLIFLIPRIRDRVLFTFSESYILDSTLDGRIWSFINGFHIFKQYPFLGTGPGTYGGQLALNFASPIYLKGIQNGYTALYFTDNQWLEILVQTGIVGALLFLGFIVALATRLIRTYLAKKDIMNLVAAACLTSFVINGFFANVLEFAAVSMPLGFILGVSLSEKE